MGYQTRSHGLILAALLLASPVAAQVRPGNFSTLNTTDTTANSVHVGCAVGSSTCTGGILTGTLVGLDATDSTTSTTGAFKTAGGLGVAKALFVGTTASTGGLVTVGGGFAVQGTTSPAAGSGLEMIGGAGPAIQAFNRTGGAYLAIIIDALNHQWKTSNTLRWGINAAGDLAFGASSHIALSSGTPTDAGCTGGGCSQVVSGTDYAPVSVPTSATSVLINFGHAHSNAPNCIPATDNGGTTGLRVSATTTGLTVSWGGTMPGKLTLVCAGF